MLLRLSALTALGGFILLTVSTLAQEEFVVPADVEQIVSLRKDMMREDGSVLRSVMRQSGEEAIAGLEKLRTNYSHFEVLFPVGSDSFDSDAMPEIWDDWETFIGILDEGKAAADNAIIAARNGDAEAYQESVANFSRTCGECHQLFRY